MFDIWADTSLHRLLLNISMLGEPTAIPSHGSRYLADQIDRFSKLAVVATKQFMVDYSTSLFESILFRKTVYPINFHIKLNKNIVKIANKDLCKQHEPHVILHLQLLLRDMGPNYAFAL